MIDVDISEEIDDNTFTPIEPLSVYGLTQKEHDDINEFFSLCSTNEPLGLLYKWVSQGKLSKRQFRIIIRCL